MPSDIGASEVRLRFHGTTSSLPLFPASESQDTLLARACPQSEEVGVEHLLRDVKDMTISTLANQARAAPAPVTQQLLRAA